MTDTPILGIPEAAESTAVPWEVVNYMVRVLEAGTSYFTVLDRDLTTPPGSPADGDRYIVATGGTGAWTGWDGRIVVCIGGAWFDIIPLEGFRAYVQDENLVIEYSGSAWGAASGSITVDTDGTLAANSDSLVASQKATKTYVDAKVAGLSWKQAVRVATTAAGTLASSFENGDTVDGVALATGDRILIKNQSTASENGIYTVNASGAPTRATDADSGAELVNASVYVSEGTTNADTQWTCTTNATITVGSTSLAFAQLSSGGGGGIDVEDEGVAEASGATTLNFVGAGVSAADAGGGVIDVTIPGGGLNWKLQVRVATTTAGTLASSFENGDTVDGVVLATGDRILIKDQAAPAENGIYVVAASGAPTRATDADSEAELIGAAVHVTAGTANASTQWACITPAPITVNTTALTFTRVGSGSLGAEGTWTPTLKFGGATTGITYGTQKGVYSRIGNLVFVSFAIGLTNKGSATGSATIEGLPFAARNHAPTFDTTQHTGVQYGNNTTTKWNGFIDAGGTVIRPHNVDSPIAQFNNGNYSNTSIMEGTFCYLTGP